MAGEPEQPEVTCVHCRKVFRAEVLAPDTEHAGFKCPHCRLYMPLERAKTDDNAGAADVGRISHQPSS